MKARVGIVGYGMGNIGSLGNAFQALGTEVFVAKTPAALWEATHLVLPGVGAFPQGRERLRAGGFDDELRRLALDEGRPLLGVCLGMQLLASVGEEHRVCDGLGFIPGRVTRLDAPGLRVPHIGWNDTVALRDDSLLGPAGTQACLYYVHSFHFAPDDPADITLRCEYGQPFAAGVRRGAVFGAQFHPEKSHADGLAFLRRFVEVASPC